VPTALFVILVRMILTGVREFLRRRRAQKPKPLCTECAFAHIQFGACGRRAVSCTFGGGVRTMQLDVLYCTDYRPRSAPARPAIGFSREISSAKAR
jgi:hypothetical protein